MCKRFEFSAPGDVARLARWLSLEPSKANALVLDTNASGANPIRTGVSKTNANGANEDATKAVASESAIRSESDDPTVSMMRAAGNARPLSRVCVVARAGGLLDCVELTWGYPVSWQAGVVYNTRLESALAGSSLWRESFEKRRCIVPACAFYEGRPSTRFVSPTAKPLLFAGIYENDHFSVVTTEPNRAVARVHDRMPLMLSDTEARLWLDPVTPLSALEELANVSRETFAADSQLSLF